MIGSTSWMIPGTYLDNAKILEGLVDFMEFLIYKWDGKTKRMLFKEMPFLLEMNLKYTVHLPFNSVREAKKAFDFFEDAKFPILNYVLHPMNGWKKVEWNEKVAVENLKDKIEFHDRMVFDVGHHLLGLKFPHEFKKNIVEIHLMGVKNGVDHLKLDRKSAEVAMNFMKRDPLVNFEIFSLEDLKSSIEVWKEVSNAL
jgi:hypothetical protein